MIRKYRPQDLEAIKRLHVRSGLPANCFPDIQSRQSVVQLVSESRGVVTQAAFVKLVGEGYVLVDHDAGTPQERWASLGDLIARGLHDAAEHVDQVSCWIPPTLEKSFGPKLEVLGFIKSPWQSYTANLF